MPTKFVITAMWMLCAADNSGNLAPVPKESLPSGFTSMLQISEQGCENLRGRMPQPNMYVCQRFDGEKTSSWRPAGVERVEQHGEVAPAPTPEVKPGSIPTGGSAAKPAPKAARLLATTSPKRVARYQEQQQFDPLSAIIALFVPRQDW